MPIREIVVRLFRDDCEDSTIAQIGSNYYSKRIEGYKKWFELIPTLQKQHPRIIFNNQQLIPISKVKVQKYSPIRKTKLALETPLNNHPWAVVSELYKYRYNKLPMEDFYFNEDLKLPTSDLDALEDLVIDCYTQHKVVIERDAIGIAKAYKRRKSKQDQLVEQHKVLIRDPDIMAACMAGHMPDDHIQSRLVDTLKLILQMRRQANSYNHTNSVDHLSVLKSKLSRKTPRNAKKIISALALKLG